MWWSTQKTQTKNALSIQENLGSWSGATKQERIQQIAFSQSNYCWKCVCKTQAMENNWWFHEAFPSEWWKQTKYYWSQCFVSSSMYTAQPRPRASPNAQELMTHLMICYVFRFDWFDRCACDFSSQGFFAICFPGFVIEFSANKWYTMF